MHAVFCLFSIFRTNTKTSSSATKDIYHYHIFRYDEAIYEYSLSALSEASCL